VVSVSLWRKGRSKSCRKARTYDARLQEVLALSIAKCLKRKQVQYGIRAMMKRVACGCFRMGFTRSRRVR